MARYAPREMIEGRPLLVRLGILRKILALGGAGLLCASCEPRSSVPNEMLERGFCVAQQRYLTDEEFFKVVLVKWKSVNWTWKYLSVKELLSARPKCCTLKRYPRTEDWKPGIGIQRRKIELNRSSRRMARVGLLLL
jgi:hypothetical protein